jgi:hypothetical protein
MLLGFVAGCTGTSAVGDDPIDFNLQLRPLTPLNQSNLFDNVVQLKLAIDRGADGLEVHDLGAVSAGGSVETPEIAALDGSAVNIYGYDADGVMVAYGRSSAWTLPEDGDDKDVNVLMSRVGAIGSLTELPGNEDGLVGGQLVATGEGRFALIGGDPDDSTGTDDAVSDILRFDVGRPNRNLSFVRLNTLPNPTSVNDTESPGYAGHTATRLTGAHSSNNLVLVAGGGGGMLGSSTVTDQVGLWNPDTELFVKLGDGGELPDGVFHHTADEFGSGYVALLGGGVGRSSGDPVEDGTIAPRQTAALFKPTSTSTDEIITGPTNSPLLMHDAATLDGATVLVCGGLNIEGSQGEFSASDRCDMVDEDAILEALTGSSDLLPLPLLLHDMTALPDGRVLLTGGYTTSGVVGEGGTFSASDEVWAYSSVSGWQRIGSLQVARGLHGVAVLPDGNVLIVGGSTDAASPLWSGEGATGCAEILDPIGGESTLIGTCTDDIDGPLSVPVAMPMLAVDPDHGVLIVGGLDDRDNATNQVALFVGGIPEPE